MSFAKKVTLIPHENQIGGGIVASEDSGQLSSEVEKTKSKSDKIKFKIYDKIHRFIKIILKLARSVGYDENLRIKLKSGNYLENSNIVDLLTHAMSAGKILYGENEFIELLHESQVDPDLIINDNVRSKLIEFSNRKNNYVRPILKKKSSPAFKRKSDELSDETDDANISDEPPKKKSKALDQRDGEDSSQDIVEDEELDNNQWQI